MTTDTLTAQLQEEARGALARGYCTKENETKVLDSDLIEAMAREVDTLIATAVQRARKDTIAHIYDPRDHKEASKNVLDFSLQNYKNYCNKHLSNGDVTCDECNTNFTRNCRIDEEQQYIKQYIEKQISNLNE